MAEKSPQTNFWLILGKIGKDKNYNYDYVNDSFVEEQLLKITKYAKQLLGLKQKRKTI